MALWLDLIPKLHRADGHDDGFDQLDAADDRVSVAARPSSDDHARAVPTAATSTLATYSARKLFLRSPAPTSVRSPVDVESRPAPADGRRAKSTIAPRVAFAATLAIGCLALVVNCVIFVVVYRRRVDLKRLPPTADDCPPSPSVNVVGASTKSSVDGRCADGVVPHGHGQHRQCALYVATALADHVDDDPGGRQDTQRPSPAGRHRSTPAPPPPPSLKPSSYSPRRLTDGCLLRRSTEHANHVSGATSLLPRTTANASNVWVQLTTH